MNGTTRALWIARGAALVAPIAVFAWAVPGALLLSWDDKRFIVDNPEVHAISLEHLVSMFSRVQFEAYHPLHLLSYWLDVPWAGASGPVLHVVNLLLWLIVVQLLLELCLELGLPVAVAALCTILWAIHPIQVEVVTWATGRKDILANGFAIAMVLCHLRGATAFDRWAWASRACYLLGALAKTTILPMPAVLVALDVLVRGWSFRHALGRQAVALALAAGLAAIVFAIWIDAEMFRPEGTVDAGDVGGRLGLMADTLTHHLRIFVWPADNAALYPIDRTADDPWWVVLGPVALAVAIGLAVRARARRELFALVAFAILYAPVSNFVPLYWYYVDRWFSLPMLGLALLLGFLLARGEPRARRGVVVAGALILSLLGVRAAVHSFDYTDDLRLWQSATIHQPRAFFAWMKLGEVHRDREEWAPSIRAYERAVAIEPRMRLGHAALFVAITKRDEARAEMRPSRALALGERYSRALTDPDALLALAGEMVDAGYTEAALVPLGHALDLRPLPDERLERAATIQLQNDRKFLARYYVSRMRRPPFDVRLTELVAGDAN